MEEFVQQYGSAKVAITGGNGYLSSALREALAGTAAEVMVVSRRDLRPIPGVTTLRADIRESGCWRKIIQRSDVIFHLAGNTSVAAASKDPRASLCSTVLPIVHLAAAARDTRCHPRVLFASTATVYGLTTALPVSEDVVPKPATSYDLHKFFAEKELELASQQGILDGVSLRLANVYGPSVGTVSALDRGVLNKAVRFALSGADIKLYGDGNCLRDYVYIDDVVRAFLMVGLQAGISGCSLNVASGTGVRIRDAFGLVVARVERASGARSRLRQVPWPTNAAAIEFRDFVADVTGLSTACGWRPTVSLTEGVDRLIDFLLHSKGTD